MVIEQGSNNPGKVLVVEDSRNWADLIKGFVSGKGHEVVTASSAEEAQELLMPEE